jgi:hemerythrin-like domain-containing protein
MTKLAVMEVLLTTVTFCTVTPVPLTATVAPDTSAIRRLGCQLHVIEVDWCRSLSNSGNTAKIGFMIAFDTVKKEAATGGWSAWRREKGIILMKSTKLLSMDHRAILRALGILKVVARNVGRHDPDALADAKSLLGFFREFADQCHHTKEESLLFPRLMSAGMAVEGGPLGVMLSEHEQARALVTHMCQALDSEDRLQFALHAEHYSHLLAGHIEKEDQVLFTMAESALTEEDDSDLVTGFEAIEERLGADVHEKFHRLLLSMEYKYLAEWAG